MNVKEIIITIGGVALAVLAFILGRGTKRQRVPGVRDNLDTLGDSVGRATAYNNELGEHLDVSARSAGEIADRNRDNVADVSRAKEILRLAKARRDKNNDTG